MPARKGFELQDGDIELLHYVYLLRLATVDHLSALSGRSVRALWGRLHKLSKRRYLAPVARLMQKNVYAVGSAGVPVLIEEGYAPASIAEKRLRHNELKDLGLRHAVFIADIHAHVMRQTKSGSITLTHWQEGSAFWNFVVAHQGDAAIPIRPDAYFIMQHTGRPEGKNTFHVFLEADRSTMSHERMASKITGFLAYYDKRLHAKKYPGMQAFLVATVTGTRARAEELSRDLLPLIPRPARRSYLFIPFEELTLATLLPKSAGFAVA